MLETTATARRIQSLKEALQGRTLTGQGIVKSTDLGDAFAAARIPAEALKGDGATRYAAVAELLIRAETPGLRPRRFADTLVELGYTPTRIDRVLAMRGPKLCEEILAIFRRARTAGMSPDPYLACTLLIADGAADEEAADTRRRIVGEYHRLSAA